ncbi:MAG: ABC transporter permease [Thiobacillaceae bacterium]
MTSAWQHGAAAGFTLMQDGWLLMNAKRLTLSLRFLLRDWRAGELRILGSALLIAVTTTSAISFLGDRLQRGMVNQSAALLGADLVLRSPRSVDPAWLEQARADGLRQDEVLEFPSVVLHGDNLQLCDIKAVQPGYPLRGALRTAAEPYSVDGAIHGIPKPGEAWVEARLLPLLQAQMDDAITLGNRTLRLTRILTFEPGGAGNFAALAPEVLVNQSDAQRAGVLAPGSRVTLNYQFAGSPAAIGRYRTWLRPFLGPSDQLIELREGQPAIGSALDRAERYLGLASLAAVLLAGVAIAMGARRYSERHFDVSAMLRCLGAGQRDIVALYVAQLGILGLLGGGLGVVLGYGVQFGLFLLLRDLLPTPLPPPGPLPALFGLFTGLVVLAGFALPPVLRLKDVPALRVLRRELTPLPLRAWLVYGAAFAAMSMLLWRFTGDATLTLIVLGGGLVTLLAFGSLAWGLLRASRALHRGVGVAWRYGINNLWRRPWLGVGQILAFGLVLMAMALTALLRNDLITTWRNQLPVQAANHFAVNILPDQVVPFGSFLRAHHIVSAKLYPMVRGRLTAVNGVDVADRARRNGDARIRRDLNLTWSGTLPAGNAIVTGHWWRPTDRGMPQVSVEQGVAERLGLKLGDVLTFSFGDQALQATVASVRTVQWDSFIPNFFMIFPPGVIEQYPATYITSFYLPPTERTLLAAMVRTFPAVTVIDIDRIMDQVRLILAQGTLAVEYLLVLVLLAGFAVLYAALQASLDERLYEGALLRTLGASRYQLRAGHLAEYAVLGVLAGLFAAAGAELIAWLLYTRVFHLEYQLKWQLWATLPALGAFLIGIAGYWGTRRVVQRSPLIVLRGL